VKVVIVWENLIYLPPKDRENLLLHYELERYLLVIPSNFQQGATVRGGDASSEKPRWSERRWCSKRREARRGNAGRRGRAREWRSVYER
jgi:hypothetical protein